MRRKSKEYEQTIALRKRGQSVKKIAKTLKISVSTASMWSREVQLTEKQKVKLKYRKARISHLRKLARKSHLEKIVRVEQLFKSAKSEIHPLNSQELFLIGLALYWAEGFKSVKEGRLGFCNSDPKMIKFIIKWFRKSLKIKSEDFTLRTEFNESHKDRTEEIKNFWSKVTGLPLEQFEKSFYHRSIWLREYPNRDKYFGVLRIRVRRSSELLNKMRGWINGLSHSL